MYYKYLCLKEVNDNNEQQNIIIYLSMFTMPLLRTLSINFVHYENGIPDKLRI